MLEKILVTKRLAGAVCVDAFRWMEMMAIIWTPCPEASSEMIGAHLLHTAKKHVIAAE
jgi:hypothetical protein